MKHKNNALEAEQRGEGDKDERRGGGTFTFRKSRC